MKGKPFVRFGFIGLAALLVCALLVDCDFPFSLAAALLCLCAAAVLIFIGRRKSAKLYMTLIAVGVLLCGFFLRQQFVYRPALELAGRTVTVSGLVCDKPERAGNLISFTLQTDRIDAEGAPQKLKIRIYTIAQVGENDRFTADVKLRIPSQSDRGVRNYYISKSIFLTGGAYENISVTEGEVAPIVSTLTNLRGSIEQVIEKQFGGSKTAAIAQALLLGDRSALDDADYENVKLAGAAHLLAVSGMHTSILAAILYFLLKLLRVPTRAAAVICSLFLLFYMALLRFSPTVTRAAIMSILTFLSIAFIRGSDPLHSLGFAVTAMLLASPFSAMDVGFLLSVSATAGIIITSQRMQPGINLICAKITHRLPRRLLNALLSSLTVSIAASVFVLPVSMLCFDTVSLFAVPTSLLMTPVITVLLPTLCAAAAFSGLGFVGQIFAGIAELLTSLFYGYTKWAAGLPAVSLPTGYAFISAGICVTLLGLMTALLCGKLKKHFYVCLLCAALVLMSSVAAQGLYGHRLTRVTVYCDKSASGVVIRHKNQTVVIGAGNCVYEIGSDLKRAGIKDVQLLVFPAPQKYCKDAAELELLYPGASVISAVGANPGTEKLTYANRLQIELFNYGIIDVDLQPDGYYADIQTAAASILLVGGEAKVPILMYDYVVYLDGTCKNLPDSYNCIYAPTENAPAGGDTLLLTDGQRLEFSIRADSVTVT